MLLPEKREREYRFKLALRMVFPIFSFLFLFLFLTSTLIDANESLQTTFYFISILLFAFSIYFILFLIYKGFDERITEPVSRTFTREYLYKLLKTKTKSDYTLVLISIDNLYYINTRYGIKNGDIVLYKTIQYISKYLYNKNITNFPIGHIKGGDFIIGLEGKKEDYNTALELLSLKSSELKINDIEVNLSSAITDTSFSNNLEYMIENLFEMQEENKYRKKLRVSKNIDPNTLESYIIEAIKKESVDIMTQDVYENDIPVIQEYFIRLVDPQGKVLHPKSYMKIITKLGLTVEYDYLILQKSIATFLNKENMLFCISIHPTSLRNSTFLQKVKDIMENNPLVKDKIVFLLSESHYYSHIDRYNYTLQVLRKIGVKIAIDKLGSLHTSFLYLRDLDVDLVRFDSLYSKDVINSDYKSIVSGFNSMAQDKNIKTWLKMVQTEEVDSFAKTIGVNYRQGNILSELKKQESK